jgi:hypothetical protein
MLRAAFGQDQDAPDRDLIQKRLDKAIVCRDRIEITPQLNDDSDAGGASSPSSISIPFVPRLPLRKGVAHSPTRQSAMDKARRVSLLTVIARARDGIEAIVEDPVIDAIRESPMSQPEEPLV